MALHRKLSDEELFILLKEQDHAAFTEIYNRYWGLLYIHAKKILDDEDEVKDVLQELFTALWAKADNIELTVSLSAYLYSAIRNKILNLIEHKKIKRNYADSIGMFLDKGNFITDEQVRHKELARLIEKELKLLPPKMREIFELSRKECLSHKEIAGRLDISDKTVRKQVNNAIKILRIKLNIFTVLLILLFFR